MSPPAGRYSGGYPRCWRGARHPPPCGAGRNPAASPAAAAGGATSLP